MEIINISNHNKICFSTGVALGNFDGIHLGHQKLINVMIEKSKELGLKSSLLLFEEHTKVTTDNNQPKIITSNEKKFEIAEKLGIDIVYIMKFDENVMKLSAEEFVKEIIINKMNSKLLVVGFDYKFGYKALGNSETLLQLGEKYDIAVEVINAIQSNDEIIGSTEIRKLIIEGNIKGANKFLGRPYSIMGKVVPGESRGKTLGFPTANIEVDHIHVIPKNGVYKTNTIFAGKSYLSATNIGFNPTFNDGILKIETHILDFEQKIYGENIEIEFIDFLRDDIKFNNKEDLIKQMNIDIDKVRNKY